MKMSVQALRTPSLQTPGQYIYAYCNVRTNQVLYSLTRILEPKSLNQLPDIGANYTPPKLRKDSWRPLFSVSLPATRDGESQRLRAFEALQEYRKLHELCWEPPPSLSRRYTEKEIEKMQERLDNRGGSKTEGVHDLITREKKKLRATIVMNQKANSIADLASILLHQEDEGVMVAEKQSSASQLERSKEIDEILELERLHAGGRVEAMTSRIEDLEAILRSGEQGRRRRLRDEIKQLRIDVEKTQFASRAVATTREWLSVPEEQRNKDRDFWRNLIDFGPETDERTKVLNLIAQGKSWGQIAVIARVNNWKIPDQLVSELRLIAARESQRDSASPLATSDSVSIDSRQSASAEAEPDTTDQSSATSNLDYFLPAFPEKFHLTNLLPKKKWPREIKNQIKIRNSPVFTTSGVVVRWANMLDAEYAELWPENVRHEPLGAIRHVFPLEERAANTRPKSVFGEAGKMRIRKLARKRTIASTSVTPKALSVDAESTADSVKPIQAESAEQALRTVQIEILEKVRQKAKDERWDRKAFSAQTQAQLALKKVQRPRSSGQTSLPTRSSDFENAPF